MLFRSARSTLRTQGVLWLFGIPWLALALAALAFLIGAAGCFAHLLAQRKRPAAEASAHWSAGPPWLAFAVMMMLFTNAARIAMVAFDPYLSSRPLADALRTAPPGKLVINGAYYPFSSVVFYADREALLLNGRFNNLEYGSNAPGAPADVVRRYCFAGDDGLILRPEGNDGVELTFQRGETVSTG